MVEYFLIGAILMVGVYLAGRMLFKLHEWLDENDSTWILGVLFIGFLALLAFFIGGF